MATSFSDRAEAMGLNIDNAYKGMFSYSDIHSEVVYRELIPQIFHEDTEGYHPTDGHYTPLVGIFTKAPDETDYKYVGVVSNLYKFIGNEVLNEKIRESILSVGLPIITENTIITSGYTRMRNEIIIQNSKNIAQVGDVLPVMIVSNSYDGTRAASIAFGITMDYDQDKLTFAFNLGELRQVHIERSNTSMSSSINSYIQAFNENITDMISQSFSSRLSEDEILGVLDLIESYGKKRRDTISTLLDDIQKKSGNELPTAWQMFLAIVRYSSIEPNLNIKRMMENAAESVLVIPPRMLDTLEKIQES